jgi:hypothetical protein
VFIWSYLVGAYQSNPLTSYFLKYRMTIRVFDRSEPTAVWFRISWLHLPLPTLYQPVSVPLTSIICVGVWFYDIFSGNGIWLSPSRNIRTLIEHLMQNWSSIVVFRVSRGVSSIDRIRNTLDAIYCYSLSHLLPKSSQNPCRPHG